MAGTRASPGRCSPSPDPRGHRRQHDDQAAGNPDNLPPNLQDWGRSLGFGVIEKAYGTCSSHEAHVVRRYVPWLTPDRVSSVSFAPLHEMHAIITPSGLHFERHDGGVPFTSARPISRGSRRFPPPPGRRGAASWCSSWAFPRAVWMSCDARARCAETRSIIRPRRTPAFGCAGGVNHGGVWPGGARFAGTLCGWEPSLCARSPWPGGSVSRARLPGTGAGSSPRAASGHPRPSSRGAAAPRPGAASGWRRRRGSGSAGVAASRA